MIAIFITVVLVAGLLFRNKLVLYTGTNDIHDPKYIEWESTINATTTEPRKTRRKEYLYRLLTNTTRSLIQMEIKARRLEENMRRIKEKTSDLLWKDKDKALWHILFKNISRHITMRHQFHQHSSLRRILQDTKTHAHNHRLGQKHLRVNLNGIHN